jgi:uncharacterized protein with PIN domain
LPYRVAPSATAIQSACVYCSRELLAVRRQPVTGQVAEQVADSAASGRLED